MNGMDQLKEQLQRLFDEQLERYQGLPEREQKMLMALALFLVITIPIFGIVLPLEDERKAMVENVEMLKVQAKEAERFADQLQSGDVRSAGGNVMSDVDRIARSGGVREFMTRIKPQTSVGGGGSSLILQIKSAPYGKVVSFITALADNGLGVTQIKLQRADAAGHVHIQAVIAGN